MRALLLISGLVLLSSCGMSTETSTNQHAAAPNQNAAPSAAAKTEKAPEPATANAGTPVDLTVLGMSQDKTNVSYKIKVNSNKPIEEVHLALKEMDGTGKVVADTTLVWQNIVGSTRKPIESGMTYEDRSTLDADVIKAEVSLKEVVFKDGTRWTAH
ncbi:MAG TPA: hypothetical protein VKJ45_18515 [Blastocatellia bacterium]|nr:hypothetical protein [Blastocatellia bacterium]